MRGGCSGALAITPHDTDESRAMIISHGVEVPNTVGIFGGMPGSCGYNLKRSGNEKIGTLIENVTGPEDFMRNSENLGAKPGYLPLKQGEVLGYACQGGGGYGDPFQRDAAKVAVDVRDGMVSLSAARDLYGVVLDASGAVDERATDALRNNK